MTENWSATKEIQKTPIMIWKKAAEQNLLGLVELGEKDATGPGSRRRKGGRWSRDRLKKLGDL